MSVTDESLRLRAHLHSTLDHAIETASMIDEIEQPHPMDALNGAFLRQAQTENARMIDAELKRRRETPAQETTTDAS